MLIVLPGPVNSATATSFTTSFKVTANSIFAIATIVHFKAAVSFKAAGDVSFKAVDFEVVDFANFTTSITEVVDFVDFTSSIVVDFVDFKATGVDFTSSITDFKATVGFEVVDFKATVVDSAFVADFATFIHFTATIAFVADSDFAFIASVAAEIAGSRASSDPTQEAIAIGLKLSEPDLGKKNSSTNFNYYYFTIDPHLNYSYLAGVAAVGISYYCLKMCCPVIANSRPLKCMFFNVKYLNLRVN